MEKELVFVLCPHSDEPPQGLKDKLYSFLLYLIWKESIRIKDIARELFITIPYGIKLGYIDCVDGLYLPTKAGIGWAKSQDAGELGIDFSTWNEVMYD